MRSAGRGRNKRRRAWRTPHLPLQHLRIHLQGGRDATGVVDAAHRPQQLWPGTWAQQVVQVDGGVVGGGEDALVERGSLILGGLFIVEQRATVETGLLAALHHRRRRCVMGILGLPTLQPHADAADEAAARAARRPCGGGCEDTRGLGGEGVEGGDKRQGCRRGRPTCNHPARGARPTGAGSPEVSEAAALSANIPRPSSTFLVPPATPI